MPLTEGDVYCCWRITCASCAWGPCASVRSGGPARDLQASCVVSFMLGVDHVCVVLLV